MGKRLLLVDHALPTPDRDAGSAYTYSHLQILTGAGFDVTFLAPVSNPEDPYTRALSDLGVAVPQVDGDEELREAVERLAPPVMRALPVVTTSIGSEGGGLVDGYDALVADDPAGLAAHIVRLSRDDELWQNLSRASYETFRSRFSNEAGGHALVSIVSELAQR